MKKVLFSILIAICCALQAEGRVMHVGSAQAFKSVSAAVADALSGDTILVDYGVYHEGNLVIDKSVTLRGVGLPVIDGEHKFENVSIKADGVVLDGFKICNSGISGIIDFAGIKIYNRHYVSVINNVVSSGYTHSTVSIVQLRITGWRHISSTSSRAAMVFTAGKATACRSLAII
jgi:nitrous oxidase accessory protein